MERLECEDYLYPSDNGYEIPCLRLDRQAGNLILPFAPYGAGRRTKEARTIHFYVDDYRFSSLWKKPAKYLLIKQAQSLNQITQYLTPPHLQ